MEHQDRWYLDNIELEGRVIVDVGANVGRLSELFWRHGGERCRVVSIEPQPENVARLRERIAGHGAGNWTVEPCAVSSAAGTLRMRALRLDHGMNSVVSEDGDERPCRRLEDIAPDAQVIKVDIEGHEYEVLPTAVPALERAEVWALELHMVNGHPLERTLGMFRDHGFDLHAAGRKKDDPSGGWISVAVPRTLRWDAIAGTPTTVDGLPGVFKMLHVLARRR